MVCLWISQKTKAVHCSWMWLKRLSEDFLLWGYKEISDSILVANCVLGVPSLSGLPCSFYAQCKAPPLTIYSLSLWSAVRAFNVKRNCKKVHEIVWCLLILGSFGISNLCLSREEVIAIDCRFWVLKIC